MNKLTLAMLVAFASMGLFASTTWNLLPTEKGGNGELVLPISGSSETEYTLTTGGDANGCTVTVNSGTYTLFLDDLRCIGTVTQPFFHICNGATVTMVLTPSPDLTLQAGTYGGIIVDEGGKLTIGGNGTLVLHGGNNVTALGFPSDAKGGEITIESGNFFFQGTGDNQLRCLGASNGSTGGKIVIEGGNLAFCYSKNSSIGSTAGGTVDALEIKGGTISLCGISDEATDAAYVSADKITVLGGSIAGVRINPATTEPESVFAPTFTPAPVAGADTCYQAILPNAVAEPAEGELPDLVIVPVSKNSADYFTYSGIGHAFNLYGIFPIQFSQNLYFYLPNGAYVADVGEKKYGCTINGADKTFTEVPEPAFGLLLLCGLGFLRKVRK